jgi:hypothetical protein
MVGANDLFVVWAKLAVAKLEFFPEFLTVHYSRW